MPDDRLRDEITPVAQLKSLVRNFVDERDWRQFHSPKNLSMALAIEVAELMEHFQWIEIAESRSLRDDSQRVAAVAEEMSDVFCYLLAMANELGIDLCAALQSKMVKNAQKYPAQKYRGRYQLDD